MHILSVAKNDVSATFFEATSNGSMLSSLLWQFRLFLKTDEEKNYLYFTYSLHMFGSAKK